MNARAAVFACFLGLAPSACGGDEGYENNDVVLAVHQKAKETCSCLFVMELSEEHCAAWTKVTPDVAKVKIDFAGKRVHATALGLWSADAAFRGRTGCVLVE
mgnify:CR=1 FL=1